MLVNISKMFVINILICLAVSTSATVFIEGPCPVVEPVKDFNITAYASGTWYEISRYPNDWENRGDCVSKVFNPHDGKYKFKLTDVIDHSLAFYEGRIELAPEAGGAGLLNYISPAYKESEGESIVPVYILHIDYDKFSIGYECKYDAAKNMRHDFAWVMSRSKMLEGEAKESVNSFLKSSHIIDVDKLIWIHYTDDACKV